MSKKDEALDLAQKALIYWQGEDASHTEQHAAYHAIQQARSAPLQEPVECQYGNGGYACCEGGPCKADEQNNATQTAAPLTDELSNAVQMACQLSFKDHGRRSVNEQAWQRLMQAVAAYTHGITGKGQP